MKNGFKENLQWATLISVAGIYGYYFARVIPSAGPDVSAEDIVLFAIMLVLLIVIHIIGAIVLISLERFKEPILDERDQLLESATQIFHYRRGF